mgnify:CR=1 FL=1
MPLIPSDGVDFLLKVNTGTVETPVWTVIGGQRGATRWLKEELQKLAIEVKAG